VVWPEVGLLEPGGLPQMVWLEVGLLEAGMVLSIWARQKQSEKLFFIFCWEISSYLYLTMLPGYNHEFKLK
jgi:hypothetical protein